MQGWAKKGVEYIVEAEHIYVGIDVAKAQLDIAVRPMGDQWSVSNDEEGIDHLVSRLEALCMLFGIGLVVFDVDLKSPNFTIRVRAQKYSPDMFYVNEFARRLNQHDPGLFEELFS